MTELRDIYSMIKNNSMDYKEFKREVFTSLYSRFESSPVKNEHYEKYGLTKEELTRLATYNSEKARGIMHTPEWKARMADLQQRFNEYTLGKDQRQ